MRGFPLSSRNPELNELIASKPHIVLLNKCDMADEAATRRWKAWFGRQGKPCLSGGLPFRARAERLWRYGARIAAG